jgi:ribonuclease R
MRQVLHGDRVMASVIGLDRRGRREGMIVEVLERRLTRLIGRFTVEAGLSYVVPDDERIQRNVQIPVDARLDARNGQLVVCEIVHMPDAHRPPIGRVLTVLGDKLTPSLVVEAAIHGHDLPHEFPPPVLAEALAVPLTTTEADIAGRVDLRERAAGHHRRRRRRDFDDAVWCEPTRNGFRLIVAIADVSHYVRPGAPLDDEAQRRATSVYFPGFVVPMLPETLSNGICSLNPKVDRLCFVCDMRMNADGETTKSKFYEAVMRSHARLTYTQVWKAVGEGDAETIERIGALMPQVRNLHRLYGLLAKARKARGAIEFESQRSAVRARRAGRSGAGRHASAQRCA